MTVADKICCVYCHTNKINGKRYVGITSNNPMARWKNGKGYIHNAHFTNAINKYGWDNFEHEIIISDISETFAKSFERMLINLYHSSDALYGYNLSTGGEPMSGKKHSEETKVKMSEAAKGRKVSDETRAKISAAIKNRDPEIVYRFSHSRKGKTSWLKGKTGADNPNYGKKHTDEQKRHISEALKGRPKSAEHIAKISKKVRYIPTGEIYKSISEASRLTHSANGCISNHCNNKVKTPLWEFVKEN